MQLPFLVGELQMDLRQYFRKLREVESTIIEDFPLVISLETSDGGKPGTASEVSRFNAAKMIIEGRAALADEASKAEYHARRIADQDAVHSADLARRVQVAIVDQTALAHINGRKNPSPSGSGK